MNHHPARFECPICTFVSGFDGTCPRCDVQLQDTTHAAPWQLEARECKPANIAVPWIEHPPTLLAVLSVVLLLPGYLIFGPGPALLAYLSAFVGALMVSRVDLRALTERKWAAVHHKTSTVQDAASVHEGQRVALEGVPMVHTFALAGTGTNAMAIQIRSALRAVDPPDLRRSSESGETVVCSSGGEIELRTRDGVPVRVRLGCFVIVRGEVSGSQTIIPEGAEVRVSGIARWRTEMDAAGLRSAGRVIELEGTAKEPIVIEMTAPAQQNLQDLDREMSEEIHSPTNVRVAVASDAIVRDEAESSDAPARQAHTPSGVQKR